MVAVFTIYFEDPFWIGVLESEDEGRLEVARHVFGAEPTNAELLAFMLRDFAFIRRAEGPATAEGRERAAARDAKAALRAARRAAGRGPSTKARRALSAALEASKEEAAIKSRAERRAGDECRFAQRVAKRKRRRAGH